MKAPTLYTHLAKFLIAWVIALVILAMVMGCSSKKNTAFNRFYQGFTTRYNVYFNGIKAYDEAYKQQIQGYKETYALPILLDPATANAYEPKVQTGGSFDGAIMKGRKAISLHSIRTRPERKAGLQNDPKQVAWQQRIEYNAFLHNAWMLVGKSQFRNGDFLEAMATFAYIARLYKAEPSIRDLARLWQVRCYTAMGWLSEGRQIRDLIPPTSSARDEKHIFNLAEAERLLAEGRRNEAIPYLLNAAKYEKNKLQRARMNYLAGQILSNEGHGEEARKAFGRVIRLAPPFELDLAARIRRAEIGSAGHPSEVLRELRSMARKEKYVDVLDQIYLAIGNVYMEIPDTTKAIEAYQFAIDTSKTRTADFALSNIRLGDIYMARQQYTKAQPHFSVALSAFDKRNADYGRVSKLSADLDALVIHASAVEEQDSLQHLASLPEIERNKIIDSTIRVAREEQKQRQRQEELDNRKQQQETSNQEFGGFDNKSGSPTTPSSQQQVSQDFYFYNPQLITQGKSIFERQWGRRILEDNWRRRRKDISVLTTDAEPLSNQIKHDSTGTDLGVVSSDSLTTDSVAKADNDPLHPDYYLRRLPLTPEALAESNKIIESALYGMGQVFNDQMEHFNEAMRVYKQLLSRYPDYEGRLEILYKLYLLAARLELIDEMEIFRHRIMQEFPDEALAKAVADPCYLEKLRTMDQEQNRLYIEAFEAYLKGDDATVQNNYLTIQRDFPTSDLLPKFAFLDALGYVLRGDGAGFRTALQALVKTHPQGDVSELSQIMLADLVRGRNISRGGYANLNWDINLAGDSLSHLPTALEQFNHNKYGKWRVLLIYPAGAADRNAVIFAVSAFNYSRFTRFTLDAIPARKGNWEQVTINTLPNETESWYYIRQAYSPDGYMPSLGNKAILLPISERNVDLMEKGRTLGEYMQFMLDSIRDPNVSIVLDRWDNIVTPTNQHSDAYKTEKGTQIIDSVAAKTSPASATTPSPNNKISAIDSIRKTLPITNPNDTTKVSTPITFQIDRDRLLNLQHGTTTAIQPDTVQQLKPRPKVIAPEEITIRQVQTLYKDRVMEEKARIKEQTKARKQREKERQAELKQREKKRRELAKQREKDRKERLRRRESEKKRQAELKTTSKKTLKS